MANDAAAVALWHCAQFVLVEGALAWIAAIVGITAKFVLVWHEVHVEDVATGMWLLGMPVALNSTNPAWQLEQSPVLGCLLSATLN
jgi:hypothetical protein